MRVRHLWLRSLIVIGSVMLLLGFAFLPVAQADTPDFPVFDGYPKKGCYGYVVGGTGMWDGYGTITVDVPGPVVDAWLIWEGVNDIDDPGNPNTTTLVVNGETVTGRMTDHSRYSTIHADWYQWVADVGPGGYNLVREGSNTLNVSEWWPLATYRDGSGSPDPRRNGVSLMVIYDRSPCSDPVEIIPFYGSDYVWWKGEPSMDGGPLSMNHVFSFDAAPMDRQAHLVINFAGMDHLAILAGVCRDTAVWAAVGSGTPPDAVAETGYPGTHGVNGGVLAAKNVFNASPPCQQQIADPVVDFSGGYIAPEWSITDLTFNLPADSEWLAVQIESVSPLNPNSGPSGESGAWTGGILTIPLPPPELGITKDDGRTTAAPGEVLTYTIAYENTGQGPGYDVTITDTLPEYTTYEGCETPVGTCSLEGDQVVFNLGTVEPNTRGVVTLTVRLDDAFPVGTTDVVNRAVISNSLPGDDPANNTAEDVTQVQAEASLCVRKDDNPDPVEAGEVLTYTINWRINGNAFVNDTTITDTLDANVTFVSASHGGVYVPDAHAVRWDLGTRYPEPQPALTLVVRVKERVLNEAVLVNRVRIEVSDPGVAPARDLETTTVHSSYLPGSIGDTVWHDVNGDGVRDAGEPGIGGVTVDLYVDVNMNGIIDAEDKMVGRETTDENGHYLFENLITDHYLVTVSDIHGALAGMTKTSGTVGEDNNSQPDPYPVHLGNGESNLTADFGYTTGGMGGGTAVSIGDLVWRDGNGNGVYEPDAGEVGIPGVTLKLIRDLNGNGVIDPGEPVFGTVTTDADGHYLFTDLPPDTYIVDVTDENHVLTFYTLTTNNDPAAVDVSDGQDDLDVDFGYRPTGTGKIGDLVFYDANNDGVQQSGESGLANVEVELYGPGPDGTCGTDDDVLLARTWTDADGHYMFEGLPAGTYCVKVVESTLPEDFLVLGDHFTNPHGPITLPDGGTYLDADFGYTAAMVEGVVFDDTNGNGVQDEGEQGIGGASVCLYEKGSTTPVKCVTTDDNGYYQFPMLPPGEYQVQLTSWPRGYEPTTPVQVDVVAPAGGVGKVDFGLTQPSLALTKTFDVPPGTPVKVEVGDVVTFTIRVENTGGVALSQIGLEDTFDPTYLRFLRADPMPNSTMPEGTLTWDDLAGGGSMAPGEVYTVRVVFEALAETDATTNTATVRGVRSAGGQTLPDISDDVTFSIQAPTAVTMADILAEFDESGAVVLTWITTAEFDNWGFNVYRAEVNDPSQAVRINDTLIPGRGQSVIGATYRYVDETVERGKTYWYWIEDVELGGRTTWHGPVEVYVPDVLEPGTGGSRVFMPMVLR